MHDFRFPGETEEYRRARDELLRAELELKRRTEEVAQLRRRLPLGAAVPTDYVFERDAGDVRLSELFGDHDTLVLYNFMFGPKAAKPPRRVVPAAVAVVPLMNEWSRDSRDQHGC